jgi:hypothetical protein
MKVFFPQTLWNMVVTMLETSRLPTFLWGYAAHYAVLLMNNIPKGNDMQSNQFKWDGTILDASLLRIFGCKGYIHKNRGIGKGTITDTAEEVRFLGLSTSHYLW